MRKVLYVLTENLSIGVIKSQVLNHISFIKNNKIADFKIIVCYWSESELSKSKSEVQKILINNGCEVFFLKIYRPLFFFLNFLNKEKLYKKFLCINENFEYIHARTDYCANLCLKIIKREHLKLIWDCRGDSAAEIDYDEPKKINFIKKYFLDKRFFNAGKKASKIIFVSSFLKKKFLSRQNNKEIFIIPSLASNKDFYFSELLRNQYRKKLKIQNKTRVFIYSGSMKKYQNFPETVKFFESINKKFSDVLLIVLTQDKKIAEKIIGLSPKNIIIKSVNYNEVNFYLNAADFALMFRNNDLTNKAASPTKFAEYCLSGIKIITTSAVIDFNKYKKSCDNILDVNDFKVNRKKVSNFYKKNISRESFMDIYKQIYD